MNYHLAQANIAKMRGHLADPIMRGFVEQLRPINAVADASPGFVWRLKTTASGDATDLRLFENGMIIFNMSVWESMETLRDYVYRSAHAGPFRNRSEWFEPMPGPSLVMWWIPAGHIPTVEEAKERFAKLAEKGPTQEAFTFKQAFLPAEMQA